MSETKSTHMNDSQPSSDHPATRMSDMPGNPTQMEYHSWTLTPTNGFPDFVESRPTMYMRDGFAFKKMEKEGIRKFSDELIKLTPYNEKTQKLFMKIRDPMEFSEYLFIRTGNALTMDNVEGCVLKYSEHSMEVIWWPHKK
jgi:hypothetical protein